MKLTNPIRLAALALLIAQLYSPLSIGAPVRLSGSLSTTYGERSSDGGDSKSSSWLNLAQVNASSYIWQPWFALISGSLAFSTNEQKDSGGPSSQNDATSGQFQFNLFPSSRFPFTFYASKSQNELKDQLLDRVVTNTTIGMKQQYMSKGGRQSYNAKIEQTRRNDFDNDRFIDDTISFTGRFLFDVNEISTNLDYDQLKAPNQNDTKNYTFTTRHSYTGEENLAVENLAASTQSESEFTNNKSLTKTNQLSSFITWKPLNRSDIHLTGNLLLSELEQANTDKVAPINIDPVIRNDQSFVNLNQGLAFTLNDNVSINQSTNINKAGTGEDSSTSVTESGSITFTSDSIDSEIGSYSWDTSANLSYSRDDSQSATSLGNQIGHALAKDFDVGPEIKLSSSVSQSVSYSTNSLGGDSNNINHSLSVNWHKRIPLHNFNIRMTASDSRNSTDGGTVYQLINFQTGDDYRYGRNTSVNGNLTYQKSWINSDEASSISENLNGQLSLTKQRFLNTPSLLFNSMLNFSVQRSSSNQELVADSESSNDNSWENKLVYQIGLLQAVVNLDFIKSEEGYDQIFTIQITRYFGAQ